MVVAFAFLGDRPLNPFGYGVHSTTGVDVLFGNAGFPGAMLTKLIMSPFDSSIFITPMNSIISISLITAQWLLIGSGVARICVNPRKTLPIDGDNGVKLK